MGPEPEPSRSSGPLLAGPGAFIIFEHSPALTLFIFLVHPELQSISTSEKKGLFFLSFLVVLLSIKKKESTEQSKVTDQDNVHAITSSHGWVQDGLL